MDILGIEFGTDAGASGLSMRSGKFRAETAELIMVTRLTSAATIIVLMSVAPMAQSAPSTVGPSARFIPTVPADVTTVTNYLKQNVYDPSNNKIGDILDLVVEKDGRITAAMVGVGGFLGLGQKNVVIPFDALTVSQKNNHRRLTLNTTKDALKSAPGFTYDRATDTWVSDKSISNADRKLPQFMGTMPRE
jgi:sporulation protein YlmC with PRC-barrel domain